MKPDSKKTLDVQQMALVTKVHNKLRILMLYQAKENVKVSGERVLSYFFTC